MKKKHFVFMCLSFLGLYGILFSGARAQETEKTETYPVSYYGLTAAETASELPSDGWTEFELLSEGVEADTLNKFYLRSGGLPVNMEKEVAVELNAIGFDFPYGGRTMTHFGVTGNGLIYLGTESAEVSGKAERLLQYTNYLLYYQGQNDLTDVILAFPRNSRNEVEFVADARTKIGYRHDADQNALVIGFRDLSVRFTTGRKPDFVDHDIRLSYSVILDQDGRIQFAFDQVAEPMPSELSLVFGLLGPAGEMGIHAADWTGKSTVVNSGNPLGVLSVKQENIGTALTFTLPQACERPAAVEVTHSLQDVYSMEFTVNLTLGADCDGWLVFVADKAGVAERPEDGRVYSGGDAFGTKKPDTIGGFPVKGVWEPIGSKIGQAVKLTVKELKPDQDYYIYVYPYNVRCLNGPLYQQEPTVIPVKTLVGAPAAQVESITASSVRFAFPGLAAGTEILVGMSRRDYMKRSAKRYEMDDISGKAYVKGDTVMFDAASNNNGPFWIEAVYAGTVTDGALTINDLEPGTPYYFYFWTVLEGEKQYSREYVEKSVLATPATPFTFKFNTDRAPASFESCLPAGWSRSDSPDRHAKVSFKADEAKGRDEQRILGVNFTGQSGAGWTDAVTPAFRSTHAAFDLRYRFKKTVNNKVAQLAEGDSLTVWYKADGSADWRLLACVTAADELVYADDDFATLRVTASEVPTDRDVRLRFKVSVSQISGMSLHSFVLHHILVEPHLNCAYPENIAVLDSLLTHRTIGLSWEDENEPVASVAYRYREAGTEAWSALKAAQQSAACIIRPLQTHTAYEVALQAVCQNGDSSLVKTIEATTLYGLPWQQALTDLKVYPAGFAPGFGVLPADGAASISEDKKGQGFAVDRYSGEGHTAAGISFGIVEQEKWLAFPVLCLEDRPAPAELTFQYKAFYRGNSGQGEPESVDAESAFRVLVLVSEDGSFSRKDSVGELRAADMKMNYQIYTIDLSSYTRKIHVALYAENPAYTTAYAPEDRYSFFIVDSLGARYTDGVPCDPVENIAQYDLTNTGVTLSWTGYSLEYGVIYKNEMTGTFDTAYTAETTYTLTDLEPGTLYTYWIVGYCEEGHRSPGALSEEKFFWTDDICGVPSDFAVLETTWQAVKFTFTSAVSATKQLHFWAKDRPDLAFDIWKERPGGVDTVTYTGLYWNTDYLAAVRSICAPGDTSVWTDTIAFSTPVIPECGAPGDLKCDRVGLDYAVLSWTAGGNNDYYNVMYRPADKRSFDTAVATKTTFRLNDLTPKTTYVWQLQAVCDRYLLSPAVKGADFTTEGTVVEWTSCFAGLKVGSQNGRIAIWNADALPIDRVEVYGLTGRLLYGQNFRTTDHLLLPLLEGDARMVLVRVFSAGETAVYKIVLS